MQAISVLAAIVTIHELGHFIAARSQNIHVTKFSIGFGPALFKYQASTLQHTSVMLQSQTLQSCIMGAECISSNIIPNLVFLDMTVSESVLHMQVYSHSLLQQLHCVPGSSQFRQELFVLSELKFTQIVRALDVSTSQFML